MLLGLLLLAFLTVAVAACIVVIVVVMAGGIRAACRSLSLLVTLVREVYRTPSPTSSFWRWPTTLTYLLVLWMEGRLLTGAGMDPHTYPMPFVAFGIGFGSLLWLLERRATEAQGPKGRE